MHLYVLLLVFALILHDQLAAGGGTIAPSLATHPAWTGPWLALVVLGPKLVLGLLHHAGCRFTCKRLGIAAGRRAFRILDRAGLPLRWLLLASFSLDLHLGFPLAVRRVTGDLLLLDEILILLPALLLPLWLWVAYYPIERRFREADLIRRVDQGLSIAPILTRGQFVLAQFRHQMAIVLAPLLIILAWTEAAVMLWSRWGAELENLTGPWGPEALQFTGVAVIIVLAPLLIRLVLDTTALPPGELRDHLSAMCARHRVRVHELLLWRTFGHMINAAVMGLLAPVRYVMLTDALIESMPRPQVQAVMAHELAHVKKHHLPWLLAAAAATLILLQLAWASLLDLMPPRLFPTGNPGQTTRDLMTAIAALAGWSLIFGYVSRRYERQADAFAAVDQALANPQACFDAEGRRTLDPASVAAVITALQLVADLNHLDVTKKSWRHGSIRWRQNHLRALVDQPLNDLPIDRVVTKLKWATVAAWAALAVVHLS
jgi:STE24 endopeptidase